MAQRHRTIDEIRRSSKIKMSELAQLTGVRYGTVKFYAELGLLPFHQDGVRLTRYFDKEKAVKRLSEIIQLKKAGASVVEIVKRYKSRAS